MKEDSLMDTQDVIIHRLYIPEHIRKGKPCNLKREQQFFYKMLDVNEGEYISSGKEVWKVLRHPRVPDSIKQPWLIDDCGLIKFRLIQQPNVYEGHPLDIPDLEVPTIIRLNSIYTNSTIAWLQKRADDVEKFMRTVFWYGEWKPTYSQTVIDWYNNWLFEQHIKDWR